MSTTAVTLPAPKTPSRQWLRLGWLFVAPGRLFEDIRLDQTWWLPFVLTVACSLTMSLSAVQRTGLRGMAIATLQSQPSAAAALDGPAEQREQAIGVLATTYRISMASTPVLILLYNALYGFLLWFCLSAIGEAEFGAIFAVLLYADLIQDLKSLLGAAVVWLMPDPGLFNIQNPFGSNAGYYLGEAPASLRTLLEAVDGFTIWYLVVIALGCAVVGKVKRRTALSLVFGLWLFIVAVRVMWTSIA